MFRSQPRAALLLALVAPRLGGACHTTGGIRDSVDAENDPLRMEAAEESLPAVDLARTAARMNMYIGPKEVEEQSAANKRVEPDTSTAAEEAENKPAPADADEVNESLVAVSVVAARRIA